MLDFASVLFSQFDDGDVDGGAQLEGVETNKQKVRNAFQSKGSSAVLS